jgi:dTDP-glucose 4,6-dehydratase
MGKILVTGGAGFIGSNFVIRLLGKYPDLEVVVLDKLTYAGNMNNLKDVHNNPRFSFVKGDICDKVTVEKCVNGCDTVVNFAAESHVDRSIADAGAFVNSNIIGVFQLLEACRKFGVPKFQQISTDEVYGSASSGSFDEESKLNPSNPYSASKASADLLVKSYFATYGLPVVVTRSTNNYGPRQHTEKLIPKMITNAMNDRKLPVYGDGKNVRDWIHVFDNCDGIETVMEKGKIGEVYNIGGGNERANVDIVRMILRELGKSESLIEFVKDRPGHDRRYSLKCSKLKKLGWSPKISLEEGIRQTVDWYNKNGWWIKTLKTG